MAKGTIIVQRMGLRQGFVRGVRFIVPISFGCWSMRWHCTGGSKSSISAHSDSYKEIRSYSSSLGTKLTRELCAPEVVTPEFVTFYLNKKG